MKDYLSDINNQDETITNEWSEKTEKENNQYLKEFRKYLYDKGLSLITIKKYTKDVDLFLNTFLVDYTHKTMK